MNKLTKIGLILQIPNSCALTVFILMLLSTLNWTLILSYAGWIILGVVFGLVNIFSFILLVCGVLEK